MKPVLFVVAKVWVRVGARDTTDGRAYWFWPLFVCTHLMDGSVLYLLDGSSFTPNWRRVGSSSRRLVMCAAADGTNGICGTTGGDSCCTEHIYFVQRSNDIGEHGALLVLLGYKVLVRGGCCVPCSIIEVLSTLW